MVDGHIEHRAGTTRRGAIGSMAALAATAGAGAGLPGAALAAGLTEGTAPVRTFSGRYTLPDDLSVEGLIVRPLRRSQFDVVLLLHAEGQSGASLRQAATRYARSGYLVVAPDLRASFGRRAGGTGHDALMAAAASARSSLARMARGSGKVTIVRL